MNLIFSKLAWEQYLSWQQDDVRMLKKINALLKDCQRHPEEGLGQPEPLKHEWTGWWSRRIDQEHRLVCRVDRARWRERARNRAMPRALLSVVG